jgi:hypothetical protein
MDRSSIELPHITKRGGKKYDPAAKPITREQVLQEWWLYSR